MAAAGKALALAAFGARGTGKTAWVLQQIRAARPPRLMIWDFKHDPALEKIGTAYRDIGGFIRSLKGPAFQSRYMVNHAGDIHQQFEFFCLAAWQAGCLMMFVDELPEVTKANKAPPAWRRCVNVGRDYKDDKTGARKWLAIIGAGQRPAECDKSFIGNCDIIHTGRLANTADAKVMGQSLSVDFRELLALPDLAWVERHAGEATARRGKLTFTKNISVPVAKKAQTPAKRLRDGS
jgi:hypothetical protein